MKIKQKKKIFAIENREIKTKILTNEKTGSFVSNI